MAGRFSVKTIFEAIDKITAPIRKMGGNVAKFSRSIQKGLLKTIRITNRLSRSLLKVGKSVFRFGRRATLVAIAATGVAITKVANAADDLLKTSERLSFPIEELQKWQFVAKQSGLSTDEFDKGLVNFSRGLAQAKTGTGSLIKTVSLFNPALARQIKSTENSTEAFELLIKEISETTDESAQLSLAMAVFGRNTGPKFINIVKQSEEALEALKNEAIENGITTLENAKNAELYNDALGSLKSTFAGLLKDVILPLLPKLTEMIQKFRNLILTNRELIISRIVQTLKEIRDVIFRVVDVLKKLNQEHDILNKLVEVVKFLGRAFQFVSDNIKPISILIGLLVAFVIVVKVAAVAMAIFAAAIAIGPIGLIIGGVIALISVIVTLGEAWGDVGDLFQQIWANIVRGFEFGLAKITAITEKIKALASFLNFGNADQEEVNELFGSSIIGNNGAPGAQVISPQERVARSIQEQKTTHFSELTIKDETGRAEVTGGTLPGSIQMLPSGAF